MHLTSASSKATILCKASSFLGKSSTPLMPRKPNSSINARFYNINVKSARPTTFLPSTIDVGLKYHEWLIKTLALSGTFKDPFVKAQYLHFSTDSNTFQRTLGGRKAPPLVSRVVVVGSGGLSIGQAGEFDYSGMNYKSC
jgi:hypothetical protein